MADLPPHADPRNTEVKPGYKSTEFWAFVAATIIGAILTSGFLDGSNTTPILTFGSLVITQALICKVGGIILVILSYLGYAVPRPFVKAGAIKGATILSAAEANASAGSNGIPPGDLAALLKTIVDIAAAKAGPADKAPPSDPLPPSL